MKEQNYRAIGWLILVLSVLLALFWSINESGPTRFFIGLGEKVVSAKLTQISWLLTFLVVCLPGYLIKNYFEGLAWNAHVESLPPPDARESARRSKYVKVDNLPPAPPKPVKLESLPEGQDEFVASCPACGNFFSASRSTKGLKCPSCGEAIPVDT